MSCSAVRLVSVALLSLLLASCTTRLEAPKAASALPPTPAVTDLDALLTRMTLGQKIAQLVVIGFDGTTLSPELREMLVRYQVGGVILFARNVESPAQVARLTNEIQSAARGAGGLGVLIAIDQEGGRVARLTLDKGFSEFPGAMAIGATAREPRPAAENARRMGAAMAEEMRAVGINTDFAPDLDVNNNPANPVIGVRSFSSDPRRVAELGSAFVDGLQGAGVLAFGKHFPGHGDTGTDSHVELPVVAHPRARLDAVEFVPFKAAIAANIAGIMSAHVSFPTIDPTPGVPGTLSAKVLTGLLRDELHYDGLVATDSLEMGALGKSGFPAPRAAARALRSGADLLLFNSGHELHQAAIAQVVAEVRAGAIPPARLDEAARRVLRAKARFGLLQPAPVDPAAAEKICAAPAHRALAAGLTAASITLLRDDVGILPLRANESPVVIVLPVAAGLAQALHGTEVRLHDAPSRDDEVAALKAIKHHPGAPVVLTLAGARPGGAQADLAKAIVETGARVVLVAVREPYDLLAVSGARAGRAALVASYGANPLALDAVAAVLRGATKPAGHLPVEMPGAFPLGAGLGDFTRAK